MAGVTATISVQAFRADWLTHMPMRALCERYTISRDQVVRLKHVWELPPRHDRRLRFKPEKTPDPTPRQIARICLQIQQTWTAEVEQERRACKVPAVHLRRIDTTEDARDAMAQWGDDE